MAKKQNERFVWGNTSKKFAASSRRRLGQGLEQLESRELLHGGCELESQAHLFDSHLADEPAHVAFEGNLGNFTNAVIQGDIGALPELKEKAPVDQRTLDQQMGLPMLNSNPGAPVTVYLDFNGNFIADWWYGPGFAGQHYRNVSTPVFSLDRDTASFDATEQALIREVWARVSEDFAPFNINVSTAYYGSFNNGQALKVVIGGSNNDWLKLNASGYASIGSFTDAAPNEVFVFDLAAWARAGVTDGDGVALQAAAAIATTASHEAGHAFGLRHHSLYNVSGTKMTDYNPGGLGWTPIMGDNLASDRTTWDAGPTDLGANTYQADIEVLASSANGFGFRADDVANQNAQALALSTSATAAIGSWSGKGIIGDRRDIDVFKFTTQGGQTTINVNAAQFGPNLIPVAELWSTTGYVSRATGGSLTQSVITATLPAGTYYVQVKSFGDYGGVGQYTVNVSNKPPVSKDAGVVGPTTPTTPTKGTVSPNLTATKVAAKASGGSAGQSGLMMEQPVEAKSMRLSGAKSAMLHDLALESMDDLFSELKSGKKSIRLS